MKCLQTLYNIKGGHVQKYECKTTKTKQNEAKYLPGYSAIAKGLADC